MSNDEIIQTESSRYVFDGYIIDVNAREILDPSSSPVGVEPKVFDLICFLLENRDRVVTKDELIDQIWEGRIISDSALATVIKSARRATGDDGRTQRVIRTAHGRGFRFVASVAMDRTEAEPAAETSPLAETAPREPETALPAEPQSTPKEPAATQPAPLEERGHMTALAIELSDPEIHFEELDIEDMAEAMGALEGDVLRVVEDHGGQIVQQMQTGMTALFGLAGESGEHAYYACKTALVLKQKVQDAAVRGTSFRAGIESGEALITHSSEGETSRVAASGGLIRTADALASTIQTSGILVAARAAEDVGRYVELDAFDGPGSDRLPGNSPVRLLIGENEGLSRWLLKGSDGLTPFVGRSIEMQILDRALASVPLGTGKFIGISGQPGVGKSRLAYEFCNVQRQTGTDIFQCGAMEIDEAAPLSLVRRIVRAIQLSSDPSLLEADALTVHSDALDFLLDHTPETASWTKASGAERSERIAEALLAILGELGAEHRVIFLMEDLQWMDTLSGAVIHRIIQALGSLNIMVIATYRTGFSPPWLRSDVHEVLALATFTAQESEALLSLLLQEPEIEASVSAMAYELTGGNPFFIEQAASSINSGSELDGELLPPSVQSILASNLRRLDPLERLLFQAVATHSSPLPKTVLEVVSGADAITVSDACSRMCDVGLLREIHQRPGRAFAAKHALLRNSAYAALTRKAKLELHQQLYEGLKLHALDSVSDLELARHALGSAQWNAAAALYLAAARGALTLAAGDYALRHVAKGLEALGNLPEGAERDRKELDLCKAQGVAEMVAKGWSAQEVADAYDRAAEISDRIGDDAERFAVMRGKAQYLMISGRAGEANDIAHHCCRIVDEKFASNTEFQIETSHMFWTNCFFLGDYGAVQNHTDHGRNHYDLESHKHLAAEYSGHDPGVCCRIFSAMVHTLRGELEQSTQKLTESQDLALELDQPLTTALKHWSDAYCALFMQDAEAVLSHSLSEIECCDRHKLPFLTSQANFTQGWAMARLGSPADGMKLMEAGIEGIKSSGAQMGLQYFLALLAEVNLEAGNLARARELLLQADGLVKSTSARFQHSEVQRVSALLDWRDGVPDAEVIAKFEGALSIAEAQSAVVPQLVASASFCDFLNDRNIEFERFQSAQQALAAARSVPDHPASVSVLATAQR